MSDLKLGGFNVIKHPGEDAYLLVMESALHKLGILNHTGGGFDPERGDSTLMDTAAAEAQEESGLVVRPKALIARYFYPDETPKRLHSIYESEAIGGRITPSDEHPFVGYVEYREILWLGEKGKLRGPAVLETIERVRSGNYQSDSDEPRVVHEDSTRQAKEAMRQGRSVQHPEIWIPRIVPFAGVQLGLNT